MLALICIEREEHQCHGSYVTEWEKMTFVGLEPHTFCYPGRCPKPVRLEETSNPRWTSEYIITDVNRQFKVDSIGW